MLVVSPITNADIVMFTRYDATRHIKRQYKGVFTPVDRSLCSETGIQIITMPLFICGAVHFHMAKSIVSKLSSYWSKFHGDGITINDSFGKRSKHTLSFTHTHTNTHQDGTTTALRAACC